MKGRRISPRQAIANKCKDCIYDSEAAGSWRQQSAACTVVDCALWTFRPLHGTPPAWLAARDAARLPDNWRSMPDGQAVGMVTGRVPKGCEGTPFKDNAVSGDSCSPAVSAMPVNAAYQRYSQGRAG